MNSLIVMGRRARDKCGERLPKPWSSSRTELKTKSISDWIYSHTKIVFPFRDDSHNCRGRLGKQVMGVVFLFVAPAYNEGFHQEMN